MSTHPSVRWPTVDVGAMVAPDGQSVTFVELFFDLVFVFSVTQVVGLLHGRLTPVGVAQALLVFWLVWWAWTQFTWGLNSADTRHPFIELGVLLATGIAFFMAITIPEAYGTHAPWFALSYVLVRGVGLALYHRVASVDPEQSAALRGFTLASLSGMAAVLAGGFLGGAAQVPLWALAIALDVFAALRGGRRRGWGLHIGHFAERHGLFVIIALGESLIVTAGAVSGEAWSAERLVVGILAVATTCALWWTYFARTLPTLETRVENASGNVRTQMARDVFSLLHFPLLCGVIAYAVAVEEAVLHADVPLPTTARLALAAGLLLFVGGIAPALRRTGRRIPWPRVAIVTVTAAALVAAGGVAPAVSMAVALVGVAFVAVLEERTSPTEELEVT